MCTFADDQSHGLSPLKSAPTPTRNPLATYGLPQSAMSELTLIRCGAVAHPANANMHSPNIQIKDREPDAYPFIIIKPVSLKSPAFIHYWSATGSLCFSIRFDNPLMSQINPPGREATMPTSPNKIESTSAFSAETAIKPNPVTIAPSLSPHPAIEIGSTVINKIGGMRIKQSRMVS